MFGAAAQDARPARARKPKSPGSGKKPAPIASLGASNGTVTWEKILEAVADFDAASAEKEEAAHSVPTPSPPQSPSPTQPVSSVSAGPLPQPPSFLLRAARHASRSPPEDSAIVEARQAAEVAAERLRRAGNTAFGEHRWEDAREAYTQVPEAADPRLRAAALWLGARERERLFRSPHERTDPPARIIAPRNRPSRRCGPLKPSAPNSHRCSPTARPPG